MLEAAPCGVPWGLVLGHRYLLQSAFMIDEGTEFIIAKFTNNTVIDGRAKL